MAIQGSDIAGVLDVSADLRECSGRQALAEAIARRLTTPRGSLFYDRNYGYDLRRHVNAPLPQPGVIASQVTSECLKDERVESVDVTVESVGENLRVTLRLIDASGTFPLTILASQLTVELLRENT